MVRLTQKDMKGRGERGRRLGKDELRDGMEQRLGWALGNQDPDKRGLEKATDVPHWREDRERMSDPRDPPPEHGPRPGRRKDDPEGKNDLDLDFARARVALERAQDTVRVLRRAGKEHAREDIEVRRLSRLVEELGLQVARRLAKGEPIQKAVRARKSAPAVPPAPSEPATTVDAVRRALGEPPTVITESDRLLPGPIRDAAILKERLDAAVDNLAAITARINTLRTGQRPVPSDLVDQQTTARALIGVLRLNLDQAVRLAIRQTGTADEDTSAREARGTGGNMLDGGAALLVVAKGRLAELATEVRAMGTEVEEGLMSRAVGFSNSLDEARGLILQAYGELDASSKGETLAVLTAVNDGLEEVARVYNGLVDSLGERARALDGAALLLEQYLARIQ